MGNEDDSTVLFLFIAFAVLVVLLLLLLLSAAQTWMLWKMAKAVVEQDVRLMGRREKRERMAVAKRKSARWSGMEDTLIGGRDEEEGLVGVAREERGEEGGLEGRKKHRWGFGRWG